MGNINIPTRTKHLIEEYMSQNDLSTKGAAVNHLITKSKELAALQREVVLLRRENVRLRGGIEQ